MKASIKLTVLFSALILSGCTAVLGFSGYSNENLADQIECSDFNYNFYSTAYWTRIDIMGPFIPLFPSVQSSKTITPLVTSTNEAQLNPSHCPTIWINGTKQSFVKFDPTTNRCTFELMSKKGFGYEITLKIDHSSCKKNEFKLKKYKDWKYVPPFMLTV